MTRAEYEACQARDENGFRAAIEALTRRGLETGLANVDYKALVADEWRRGNIDDVIDREVDRAIGEVREESSWFKLWSSLASREKAQELATTAAERVYRSEPMKKAIEGLATGLGKEIGKRIELATIDTAGPATQCMQAFLGRRYGTTVARIVADGAGKEYSVDPVKGGAHVSTGQVLIEGSEGIAGTVVLVVRRQLANMASRIGQRVVGSILGRLVSVVASGVGIVLIAKDIWDFRHGVLPIVADEMKSKATKDKVREELAKSIAEQIDDSLKEIAEKTAERVVEIWLEFRRAHAKVVELAERQDDFKRFLETREGRRHAAARRDRRPRAGGRGRARRAQAPRRRHPASRRDRPAAGRARHRARGTLARDGAAVVGRCRRQPAQGGRVRGASPRQARRTSPRPACSACSACRTGSPSRGSPRSRRRRAPRCSSSRSAELKALARALDDTQLDSLSRYLTGLDKASAQRVLRAVAQTPARMAELGKPRVRDAIIASSDQAAAVGMMLQANSLPDPTLMLEHFKLVLDGRVSPWLLWEKHPVALVGDGLAGADPAPADCKRLLFGTRPKIIVQQGASVAGRGRGGRR